MTEAAIIVAAILVLTAISSFLAAAFDLWIEERELAAYLRARQGAVEPRSGPRAGAGEVSDAL